ncbi:MAG TPA: DUF58 domain-containing protein [Ktedonobacterales bacterium]|nr:DUF58 domain-containing protein [Ktedonobacterales bacterium]
MKQPGANSQDNRSALPANIAYVGAPLLGLRRGRRFKLRNRGEADEILLARRPYYVGVVLLLLLSVLLGQAILFVAAILLLALILIPEMWYRYGQSQLSVERNPATSRAVFGDTTEISLVVENRKPLPLPSLTIADDFPDALPVLGMRLRLASKQETATLSNTMALWAYQRVTRRYRIHAIARGAYRFGPMVLRTSDPFGILTREKTLDATAVLLVHPLVAPIERFGLPSHSPFGERRSSRRLLEDPLRVSGIRTYEPGDEPRRIHWKATARTGVLQSKVYEPATRHTLTIFLETRTYPRALMGYDPSLVELVVSAAASVAMWGLDQGYAVGLYSNGNLAMPEFDGTHLTPASRPKMSLRTDASPNESDRDWSLQRLRSAASLRLRIPPASRPEQAPRILDGLARLLPYYGYPMHDIVTSEAARLPFGATIVYIGTETVLAVPLILALRQLRARGHAVTLLLAKSELAGDDAPDGTLYLADLPVHSIGGRERWHEMEADVLGPGAGRKASSVAEDSTRADTGRTEEGGAHAAPQHTGGWRKARPLVVE